MNNKAAMPNPHLEPFSILVGTWNTVGHHPLIPGVELHGSVTFEWIDNGAFLRMSSVVDNPQIPNGIALFGSDNDAKRIFMLYFDEREISRKYDVSFEDNILKWWRDNPKFSQRFTVTFDDDNHMTGKGEMCRDGKTWEGDLELVYSRIK